MPVAHELQYLLLAMMEGKRFCKEKRGKNFKSRFFKEVKQLEERLSEEDTELLGKKQSLERNV